MTAARLALGSAVAAAWLVAALRGGPSSRPPLAVAVAASLRPVAEAVAADFTERTGRAVELRSGGSEQLLIQLGRVPCDVFLPADDGYVVRARGQGLVGEPRRVASMRAVAVARTQVTWTDLTRPGTRLALARPETAAIGLKTREVLTQAGRWSELARVVTAAPETVTECITAVRLGAADAAVVWDAVARTQPGLVSSEPSELAGITAAVSVAPCAGAADPGAARELVEFFATHGMGHFARADFGPP